MEHHDGMGADFVVFDAGGSDNAYSSSFVLSYGTVSDNVWVEESGLL